MGFSIKFETVEPGRSIVHIKGLQVIISNEIVFISLKIDFIFANSADSDEMSPCAAFHLGLHCLP